MVINVITKTTAFDMVVLLWMDVNIINKTTQDVRSVYNSHEHKNFKIYMPNCADLIIARDSGEMKM